MLTQPYGLHCIILYCKVVTNWQLIRLIGINIRFICYINIY